MALSQNWKNEKDMVLPYSFFALGKILNWCASRLFNASKSKRSKTQIVVQDD
jgi:hypothetical protein